MDMSGRKETEKIRTWGWLDLIVDAFVMMPKPIKAA
jgi:hypothetical protein